MRPLKTLLLSAATLGLALASGWGQEGAKKPQTIKPAVKKPAAGSSPP